MALTLVSITPNRSAITAGETIQAGVTGSSFSPMGLSVYQNGTRLGAMTYHHTAGNVNYYRYDLSGATVTERDAITVQDGSTVLHSYTVVDTIVNPAITAFEIVRALSDGTESDEGTYLLIKTLKISANAEAASLTASEITVGTVTLALDSTVLEAALSSVGYSESSLTGSVFEGETFSNGVSYSGLLTIGTAYESATQAFTIARAFANMHLSGAATGGVAFGGFSSSTLNNPLLESYYPAKLYEGIDGINNYEAAEIDTGGHWVDGKSIYRQIITGSASGTAEVTLGTISGIDTVIHIEGTQRTAAGAWMALNHTNANGATYGRVYIDSSGAVTARSNTSGAKTYIVIIYYTKT